LLSTFAIWVSGKTIYQLNMYLMAKKGKQLNPQWDHWLSA